MQTKKIGISKNQFLRIQLQKDPINAQKKVLSKLLRKAQNTAFGRAFDFAGILASKQMIERYQQTVPLYDYNKMYRDWWCRTVAGEAHVSWPGTVKYFALSSGTSGAPSKKIPITPSMIKTLKRGAFKVFTSLSKFGDKGAIYGKPWLAIGGSSNLQREGGHYLGYISGINANIQPFWARLHYKPGDRIAKISEWDDRLNLIVKNAPEWDISVLVGIPHWIQMVLETIIERYEIDSIKEIWPNLKLVISGGVSFDPYRKYFQKLIGLPFQTLDTYLASEGLIAIQRKPNTKHLSLLLRNDIFFEFIPFTNENFDDNGNIIGSPRALYIGEVEPNVEYALFISTSSGTWRYIIGDTIRFVNDDRRSIVISGRTKHYLNLATEHVTIDNLNTAVSEVQDLLEIEISEYTVAGIHEGDYIAHHWFIGMDDNKIGAHLIRDYLDQELKKVNDDYRSERKTLLKVELDILPLDTFYNWQFKYSSATGQAKIPRVMKGNQLKGWLEFIKERTILSSTKG